MFSTMASFFLSAMVAHMNLSNETFCKQELDSRLAHIFTGPHISTIPGDPASLDVPKPEPRKHRTGGRVFLIVAALSLAAFVAAAAGWSKSSLLDLQSYKRGIVETIYAFTSKSRPTAQAAPAIADAKAPDVSEILTRLGAIDRDISLIQQKVNELASGQAQIRKTQLDIAVLQSRLSAAQVIANAKQNKQSAADVMDTRRPYRREYR